eukprot:7960428-Pyramimonas_sp.AAC.1
MAAVADAAAEEEAGQDAAVEEEEEEEGQACEGRAITWDGRRLRMRGCKCRRQRWRRRASIPQEAHEDRLDLPVPPVFLQNSKASTILE